MKCDTLKNTANFILNGKVNNIKRYIQELGTTINANFDHSTSAVQSIARVLNSVAAMVGKRPKLMHHEFQAVNIWSTIDGLVLSAVNTNILKGKFKGVLQGVFLSVRL